MFILTRHGRPCRAALPRLCLTVLAASLPAAGGVAAGLSCRDCAPALDDGLSLLQSVGVASAESLAASRSNADHSYGEGESSGDSHSRADADVRRGEWPFASLNFKRQTQAMQLNLGDPYRQEMINYGNAQYIVRMRVGRSTLAGMPDTGSFELLVFGSNCKTCGVTGRYNPHQSPSFTPGLLQSQHSYGDGNCSSVEAHDHVAIGPYPVTNQTFWAVEQAQMPMLNNAMFEAIVGIGPPETPAADAWNAAALLIENIGAMYDEGEVAPLELREQVEPKIKIADEMSAHPPILNSLGVQAFSVCLGMEPMSEGYITWNDDSHVKFPEFFFKVPVTGQHTWSAKLTNARLALAGDGEGYLGCAEGCSAILDTGTSLLAVPNFVLENLRKVMESKNWTCSSISELPVLSFQLGETQLSLPPDAYVAQVKGSVPSYLSDYVKVGSQGTADGASASSMDDVVPSSFNGVPLAINFNHEGNGNEGPELIQPRGFLELGDAHSSVWVRGGAQSAQAPEPKCELLLLESAASSHDGPVWILGVPFFRQYYTTFVVGSNETEREIHVAPASRECRPAQASTGMLASWRTVDVNKIYLPETAQRAATQTFMDL